MAYDKSEKILYLESLRGIAAICVALFHARHYNSFIQDIGFISNSGLMVDFFFVLSGFVIALSYSNKLNSFKDLLVFQTKRFLRLYPLHILMLLVFLLLELFKYYAEINLGIKSTNDSSLNNVHSFINNIFLTHSFFVSDLTFNGQSWSISTEFYTYLIFGLLFVVFRKNKILLFLTFICILFLAAYGVYSIHAETLISPQSVTNGFGGISRCLYSFFIGAIVYFLSNYINIKVPLFLQYVILFVSIFYVSGADTYPFHFIFAPIIFSILIFILINSEHSYLKHFLNNKFLVYLGTISYGIYMIHGLVWWLINRILVNVLNLDYQCAEVHINCNIESGILIGNSSLIIGMVITYYLSVLSYRFVEMPVNSYRHKLKFT